jgi:hypothetical protein
MAEIELDPSLSPERVATTAAAVANTCHGNPDLLRILATGCAKDANGAQARMCSLLVLRTYHEQYVQKRDMQMSFQMWLVSELKVAKTTAHRWDTALEAWEHCGYHLRAMNVWEMIGEKVRAAARKTSEGDYKKRRLHLYSLCKKDQMLLDSSLIDGSLQRLLLGVVNSSGGTSRAEGTQLPGYSAAEPRSSAGAATVVSALPTAVTSQELAATVIIMPAGQQAAAAPAAGAVATAEYDCLKLTQDVKRDRQKQHQELLSENSVDPANLGSPCSAAATETVVTAAADSSFDTAGEEVEGWDEGNREGEVTYQGSKTAGLGGALSSRTNARPSRATPRKRTAIQARHLFSRCKKSRKSLKGQQQQQQEEEAEQLVGDEEGGNTEEGKGMHQQQWEHEEEKQQQQQGDEEERQVADEEQGNGGEGEGMHQQQWEQEEAKQQQGDEEEQQVGGKEGGKGGEGKERQQQQWEEEQQQHREEEEQCQQEVEFEKQQHQANSMVLEGDNSHDVQNLKQELILEKARSADLAAKLKHFRDEVEHIKVLHLLEMQKLEMMADLKASKAAAQWSAKEGELAQKNARVVEELMSLVNGAYAWLKRDQLPVAGDKERWLEKASAARFSIEYMLQMGG